MKSITDAEAERLFRAAVPATQGWVQQRGVDHSYEIKKPNVVLTDDSDDFGWPKNGEKKPSCGLPSSTITLDTGAANG